MKLTLTFIDGGDLKPTNLGGSMNKSYKDYYRWDRIMPGDEDNVPRIESEGRNFEPEL